MPDPTESDVPAMTLRQAFDAFYLPELEARAAPATVDRYRQTLNRWEKLTGNPPLRSIDNAALARFRQATIAAGLRPTTFNSSWRDVRALLRRLGPQETRNPLGLGLLPRVPHVLMLRENLAQPRRVTLDEIDAMYRACERARWPRCTVPPAEWWRCALVVACNLGLRRNDLFGLRWECVTLDGDGPRLEFTAGKTGKNQVLPLNDVVAAHLRAIWSDRRLVFPGGDWIRGGSKWHSHEWRRLQDLAGVRFTLHDCRRTCGSAFADVAGIDAARYVLGHVAADVTLRFYVALPDRIRKAAAELPQPESFRAPKEYCVPPATSRRDWQFQPGVAVYRGRAIPLPLRELGILQTLVAAGRPLGFEELAAAWWDTAAIDLATVKGTVHRLRRSLARAFGLSADAHDCVPWDRFGNRGWTLVLPVQKLQHCAPNGPPGRPA
jgi:integrase